MARTPGIALASDTSMPFRMPDHHGVGLAREIEIVRVAPLAAQKGRILLAQHRLADAEFHQREFGVVHSANLTSNPSRRCEPRLAIRIRA
jgi:hypothetical protein